MYSYRPQVDSSVDWEDKYNLHKNLRKLKNVLPDGTPANVETCWKMDTLCQSFGELSGYSFIGGGPSISVKNNPEAEKKIKKFNNDINIHHDTIVDFLKSAWKDALKYSRYVWRIQYRQKDINNNLREMPDIQRVPVHTLQIKTDKTNGWRYFLQTKDFTGYHTSPLKFIKGNFSVKHDEHSQVIIKDSPDIVIHDQIFDIAPMKALVPYISFKHWDLVFMRKLAEKDWAPYLIATVGDIKNGYYPETGIEMKERLIATTNILSNLRNFSVAALPGDVKVDVVSLANRGKIYVDMFDKMNEQIMLGLYSSMSTRTGNSVYKGNELSDEATSRMMKGIQKNFENTLKRFYTTALIPEVEIEDIEFVWPEIKSANIDKMTKALEVASKSGVFSDASERRKAFSQIIPLLGKKNLTAEQIEKLDDLFVTLLAPSQPGESTVDAANRSKNKQSEDKSEQADKST